MLKLTKVEMLGFKSFCDRTSLHFSGDGIAAIVGPNGCGKSNISDAINWVLGEQSAKSLRGGRMVDVIFNGTRDRKPTGLAEVVLHMIDPNAEGKDREVAVARRLFRSGESEYLLNGQTCRLRDIQDIFLGTGLGPNSYAIIEQGRIGQILSSKPYDRRALIEEAAGVTRFKTKRRLAEAKLEASRQNLNRVNDILEEIGRQVNSLKRQASRAKRYGEMREELRGQWRIVYFSKQAEMAEHAANAAGELSAAAAQVHEFSSRVEALEQEQFEVSRAGYEKEDSLRKWRELAAGLALETDRARNRIEYQERQIVEIKARLKESAGQAAQAAGRIQALEEERAAGLAAAATSGADLEEARRAATELQTNLTESETALAARQSGLDSMRSFLILMLGEVSELKNQLAQVEEYLAGLDRQRERSEREQQGTQDEEEQMRGRRSELLQQMSGQQMELETVAQRKAALEQLTANLALETTQTQTRLEGVRGEYAEARARRDSLEQILSHRAYTADAVKHLFSPELSFRPLGLLADYLEVDSSLEHQVEDFLKEELEYVVVENWDAANDGLRLLRSDAGGRATFLVHPPKDEAPSRGPASLPPMDSSKVAGRLLDHVRLNNGFASNTTSLLPRLKYCYLVNSAETGRQLATAHPEYFFLAPEGECFHGCTVTGGKRTNAGPLALKRELRELSPRADQLAVEMQDCSARLRGLEERSAMAKREMDHLLTRQVEQEKLAAGSGQELKQIAQQLQRTGERLSVTALELERIAQERSRSAEQGDRLRADLAARAARRVEVETEMAAAATEAETLAGRRTALANELGEARSRAAALEERSRAAAAALERLAQTVEAARAAASEIERQSALGADEIDRLQQDNLQTVERAEQCGLEKVAAEAAAAQMQADLEAGRARMAQLEEEIRAARAELDQSRERKSAIEISNARLESDQRHLEETCRADLGISLAEIACDAAVTGEALLLAEETARQLREKIEGLGPVNMMALEEYQETAQRHEFLLVQQTDLLDSIRDTQQAIQEIDSVSRRQFDEAFEAINTNFQETFRTLFGGGYGAMRLSEEEGVTPGSAYEAGIDLVVQPPGKRLQNVLLLSGGEKALTALALLLAVFRYQPSPFCILDEVDAPLDETNIGRFTEMVGKMSLATQFIIITHSKKTMEAAPVLYGVTMPEPGVSRLVSVRFQNSNLAQIA